MFVQLMNISVNASNITGIHIYDYFQLAEIQNIYFIFSFVLLLDVFDWWISESNFGHAYFGFVHA